MEAANLLRRPVESTGESSLTWLTASGRLLPFTFDGSQLCAPGCARSQSADFHQLCTQTHRGSRCKRLSKPNAHGCAGL